MSIIEVVKEVYGPRGLLAAGGATLWRAIRDAYVAAVKMNSIQKSFQKLADDALPPTMEELMRSRECKWARGVVDRERLPDEPSDH